MTRKYLDNTQKRLNKKLVYAVLNRSIATIEQAIRQGADVHAYDDLALRVAAKEGYLAEIMALIALGADIHAKDDRAMTLAIENRRRNIQPYLQSVMDRVPKKKKPIDSMPREDREFFATADVMGGSEAEEVALLNCDCSDGIAFWSAWAK